jgi:hypothetical protein
MTGDGAEGCGEGKVSPWVLLDERTLRGIRYDLLS